MTKHTPVPYYTKGQISGIATHNCHRACNSHDVLLKACKEACAYYEMLEKATGVEHGVLLDLRQAIAKAEEK